VLAAAATCKVSTDLSRDLAIEVTAPDSLEEYDTLKPTARVLTGHGDSAATAVFWFSADSDTVIAVLDSTTGRTVVVRTGASGRLVAKGGGLVSNPLTIRTLAAADTVFPVGATLDTVDIAGPNPLDSLSDSLKIGIADTVTAPVAGGPIVPLAGRPVVYTIVHPAVAGPVTLVTQDTAHAVATTDTATSNSLGVAFVKVRLLAPDTIPDSVVVVASARRAVGTTVPGSPDTFVVRFRGVAVADTLLAAAPLADTVHLSAAPPDSLSDSLSVEVGDTSGATGAITPLPGRAVVFAITAPQTSGPVTLVTSDTARTLVTTDTVTTDARGIAAVKLRLIAGPAPASVEVTASARRGVSDRLPGSPIRFTVRFEP
jgi:hypothetical protein